MTKIKNINFYDIIFWYITVVMVFLKIIFFRVCRGGWSENKRSRKIKKTVSLSEKIYNEL